MTYPDDSVAREIFQELIALRVDYDTDSGMLRRYNVFWTPTVVLAGRAGGEQYRVTGYLPPDRFVAHLIFGRARVAWGSHDYELAAELFDRVVKLHGGSPLAPECVYFRSISRRKATGNDSHLDAAVEEMDRLYPDSEWALRTVPWRGGEEDG